MSSSSTVSPQSSKLTVCPICTAVWTCSASQRPERCSVCDSVKCERCSFVNNVVRSVDGCCEMCQAQLLPKRAAAAAASGPATASAAVPVGRVVMPAGGTTPNVGATQVSVIEKMRADIETTRAMCRQAGTTFIDTFDTTDSFSRSSFPMSAALLPRAQGIEQPLMSLVPSNSSSSSGVGGAIFGHFLDFFSGGGGGSPQPQTTTTSTSSVPYWRLFDPAVGVHPSEIVQGQLGDCWFLSAVAVLAYRHPALVKDLFVNTEINPEGVFGVRLWVDGVWRQFLVAATFPSTNNGRHFACARNRCGRALWVSVLEKAFARSRGGYARIKGGRPRDALYCLTGMPCLSFRLNNFQQTDACEEEFMNSQPEVLFSRLASFADAKCTIVACCGGNAMCDVAAQQLKLETNHAYSLLSLTHHPITNQLIVALRNPWGKSEYAGLPGIPPPSSSTSSSSPTGSVGHVEQQQQGGSFWMGLNEFVTCFSEVDVCLTREYKTVWTVEGLCIPERGNTAPRWGAFSLPEDEISRRLAFSVMASSEVHVMMVQPNVQVHRDVSAAEEMTTRAGSCSGSGGAGTYSDATIVIIQHVGDRGGSWVVHSVSQCECSNVVLHTAMLDPGIYAVVPISVSGVKSMTINVLSESQQLQMLTAQQPTTSTATATPMAVVRRPLLSPLPRLSVLFLQIIKKSKNIERRNISGDLFLMSAKFGALFLVGFEHVESGFGGGMLRGGVVSSANAVADITMDCSASRGLVVTTSSPLAATTRLRLPFGYSAVGAVAAPFPNYGEFQSSFVYQTSVTVHTSSSAAGWLTSLLGGGGGGGGETSSEGLFTPVLASWLAGS